MAQAILVRVVSTLGYDDVALTCTVRENFDKYGISRDVVIASVLAATGAAYDNKDHLVQCIYDARMNGQAQCFIEGDNLEYNVYLNVGDEDSLKDYL